MTKHPFNNGIKKYISGVDISLKTENFDSSALLAANDIKEIISPAMYNNIIAYITYVHPTDPDPEVEDIYAGHTDKWDEVLERLRYAMAPFTLFHHFIWLQLRISNDGITTYKSQEVTTAFGYQTSEAKESLLVQYAAFLKNLIDYMEEQKNIFKSWDESSQRTETQALLIQNYREFNKSFAIDNDAAFYLRAIQLMQEITRDEIIPHIGKIADDISAKDKRKLQDILAYLTISRACMEWDYCYLPTPIRKGLINELSIKNGKESDTPKELLSAKYRNKAESWLASLDNKTTADKQAVDHPADDIKIESYKPKQKDKFI